MSVAVAILTAQEVHKSYGTRLVLDGVSFAIHERDRVGILGLNGSVVCGASDDFMPTR